ncbi:MAG TPA: hypothetical protein VHM26_03385, partial [Chitinophagaceae bacterium]|nr:hypothetical protein [Chitinophagaceae bacterium]
MKKALCVSAHCMLFACILYQNSYAQLPVLETGGQAMPNEWIDKDTRHHIVKLTRNGGSNLSFYFHNNPFYGNRMVYYNSSPNDLTGVSKQETYSTNSRNKQLHILDLTTLKSEQLSFHPSPMNGEILDRKNGIVYYQVKDSVFAVTISTKKNELVYVFPDGFKASITTVNADGTLLGGAKSDDKEKEIFKNNPAKSSYFNLIYEAKLPRTLFTLNTKTKQLDRLFTDSAWLNHVQFSPTDPS